MQSYDPLTIAKSHEIWTFQEFGSFNGAAFGVFRGDALEASHWEIHRDTDELLMVLEGSVTVEILTNDDDDRYFVPLIAGELTIVPKGHWHRHTKVRDVVEMFYMPGSDEVSDAEDPRMEVAR